MFLTDKQLSGKVKDTPITEELLLAKICFHFSLLFFICHKLVLVIICGVSWKPFDWK